MRNPFSSSAGPRFVDRNEVLSVARDTARRIAEKHFGVLRVLLFGSFAREDYGIHSDIDLLVIVSGSTKPVHERLADFLDELPAYPTDMLVYTEPELQSLMSEQNHFLSQALRESIQLYP